MTVTSAQHDRIAVDVVIPVFNEEGTLRKSIGTLHAFLTSSLASTWRVVIADNASTDGTWRLAQQISGSLPHVSAVHLDRKGRGLALKTAWGQSRADVLSYMDVDLSTNLNSFLPLVAPILSRHSDVAIGTRLKHGARVTRRLKREILSRTYNQIVAAVMHSHFSDGQCGFKAISSRAARVLLPLVRSDSWFFDTELLLLAEHMGLRIFEVPVDWVEDLDSRVNIPRTMIEDLRGVWRMRKTFWFQSRALHEVVNQPIPSDLGE